MGTAKNGYLCIMSKKVSINIVSANVFALLLFVGCILVLGVPFTLIWPMHEISSHFTLSSANLFLIAIVVGVFLHEGIHGLTFALLNRGGFRNVSFGVMWKYLTPYCHYSKPMSRNRYIAGALAPFLILGVVPSVWALFCGNPFLLVYGILYISAAAGDLWMVWLILKESPKSMILDHPSEAGFYVLDDGKMPAE